MRVTVRTGQSGILGGFHHVGFYSQASWSTISRLHIVIIVTALLIYSLIV